MANKNTSQVILETYYPLVREALDEREGLRSVWFGSGDPCGIILTERRGLKISVPATIQFDADVAYLMDECEYINREARRILPERDRDRLDDEAFGVATHLLHEAEQQKHRAPEERHEVSRY